MQFKHLVSSGSVSDGACHDSPHSLRMEDLAGFVESKRKKKSRAASSRRRIDDDDSYYSDSYEDDEETHS